MSKAGIEVFMRGGANALQWFVPEGASFENPATWIVYFRNREWVSRVVGNDGFEGMNDGLIPLLQMEDFRMCNVEYLEWWFGLANSHYNRLTRQRYVQEEPQFPTTVADTQGCKALWTVLVGRIFQNLGLLKQMSFRDRSKAGAEGYEAWTISEDMKQCPYGPISGPTKSIKLGGRAEETHSPPPDTLGGKGKGGGRDGGHGSAGGGKDDPGPDDSESRAWAAGGNSASTKYCGQHLIGLLNLGDKCERSECHFQHPPQPGRLDLKRVEEVCESSWSRNYDDGLLERIKEEAAEAVSRAGFAGKCSPDEAGGGESLLDSDSQAQKKPRWAGYYKREEKERVARE